jgi:NAD(P)H-flavin reductase
VLVEGSYHKPKPPSPHCHLVAVAGGVGITAVLPTLKAHQGSKKLYWGSRAQSLIDQVAPYLANTEVEISVGRRLDLPTILTEELKGSGSDVVVLVCGPSEMADEVRAIVSTYVRKGERNIHLEDESFGW